MMIDGENHIIGVEGLAVVEFDAVAQFEDPGSGIRRGFPALREFPDNASIRCHFRQVVAAGPGRHDVVRIEQSCPVETVRRGAAAHRRAKQPAAPGLRCPRLFGEDAGRDCRSHAHGCRPPDEVAPVDATLGKIPLQFIECRHVQSPRLFASTTLFVVAARSRQGIRDSGASKAVPGRVDSGVEFRMVMRTAGLRSAQWVNILPEPDFRAPRKLGTTPRSHTGSLVPSDVCEKAPAIQ